MSYMRCAAGLVLAWAWCAGALAAGTSDKSGDWRAAWAAPGAELRPFQIVHGVPAAQANAAGMRMLKEAGLGGIVCNVNFSEYMQSEKHWAACVAAVEACREVGLGVWIYDEQGYPSAAAGGLVLKERPELEAQVLAYDPALADPFVIRRAYEFTHASNNVYAQRRYPNLIEEGTTGVFIEKTHEAYWKRMEGQFGGTIRAFFTDEPSLMTVHLGPLNARTVDPLDPKVKCLATVPWCSDMTKLYRERYGQDLMAVRRSLFAGTAEEDRVVRRRFWGLVSDLVAERYFGKLQGWCGAHRVASSGHILWEEALLHHVPLYGNALKSLERMDIPGLDVLSSDPMSAINGDGWMTAGLPMSAALAQGRRRLMTEVSDYSQRGKSDLGMMRATAGWQAALGVTEFNLYYGSMGQITKNAADGDGMAFREKYRQYCDFVGRLNAVLREAQPRPDVLLYYPIYDLWGEYVPVGDRLTLESQSAKARTVVQSFMGLGRRLTAGQVSFALADHELLGRAQVRDGGIWVGTHRYSALVLPAGVGLPEGAAGVVKRFEEAGGVVVREEAPHRPADVGRVARVEKWGHLTPGCGHVVVGRFERGGRRVIVLVNVGTEGYRGKVVLEGSGWVVADPASGEIREGTGEVELAGRGTVVMVEGGGTR